MAFKFLFPEIFAVFFYSVEISKAQAEDPVFLIAEIDLIFDQILIDSVMGNISLL